MDGEAAVLEILEGISEVYVTRRSALRRIAGLGVAQLDAYRWGESEEPAVT